jgi:cohesin complex subunit SA-1/2
MWDKLIREAANAGLLRGGFFLDKATNLIIALNTSVVRDLRKVATITAAQVATSLLHVVVTLQEARDTAAGQAKAEEAKKAAGKGGKAANERYAAFTRQKDQATSSITELLNYVDSIFQSVFMNRFRDIDPEIRLSVVQGIGNWMQLVPATFLTSGYLKYIAWAVSDKDAHVRLEAASTLCTLYHIPSNATQLKEFTDRFSTRFQELMSDKEDSVAIAGVKLVTQLVRLNHFPATVGSHVVRLMSDSSSGLRAAAADLAAGMLKDLGKEALVAAAKRNGGTTAGGGAGTIKSAGRKGGRSKAATTGNQHSDEECEIAGVLRVLRMLAAEEAGLTGPTAEFDAPALPEGVIALVVGSLATRASALRNWQLMVEWLKADTAVEVLGEMATSDLLYCLLSGLRCAAGSNGALIPPVRGAARDKQATARAKARQEATLALRDELHSLITKFQAEPAQVATAIALIPELKLEVFSLRAEEKKLSSLLGVVKNIFFKFSETSCLNACSDALVACARSGPDTTKDAARAVLSEVISTAVAEVNKAATQLERAGPRTVSAATAAYRESNGEKESAALFAARAATRRAQSLTEAYAEGFATDPSGQEGLGRILELAAAGADMPAEVLGCVATAAFLTSVHQLTTLDEENPDLAALGQLAAAQATLASQLEAIGNQAEKHGKPARDVARIIAAVQADFMTVFSAKNLPDALKEAAYRPSDTAVNALWKGLETALIVPGTPDGATEGDNDTLDDEDTTLANGFESVLAPAEIIARLASTGAVPQYRQLAAQLLSYWESAEAPTVAQVAKDVVRRLKTFDSEHLPSIYLAAMQASYMRYKSAADACFESGEYSTEELAEKEEELLQPFLDLSAKIAASQAGFNAPTSTLAYIAEEGAKWALTSSPPQSIDFLQGASYFMVRVKGSAASKVLAGVEAAGNAAGAPERPEDEDDEDETQAYGEWDLYYQYCEALREQAVKPTGGAKSRKNAANANAGGGGSGKKTAAKAGARRISFAPGAGGEESEEDEEEDVEVEEEEEIQPALRSTGGRKKGRQPAAPAAAAKKGKNARSSKPVNLADDSEEEEEEEDDVAMDEVEEHEEEEEGEDPSDEEGMIMPTEEQLPAMGGGSRGRGGSQQALEASESESDSESDDEDGALLRRPARKR